MILNDAASVIFNGREPEVWLGGAPPVKVWPSHNVVDIALGVGFVARDQFRAALTARGLDYTTITEVPFEINLTGTGEATHLFRGCVALTTGPELDTRNVTNMNGMFQDCTNLTSVPPMDTSNVTNAPSMFAYCRSLTSVPTMDAAKMIDVTYMFTGCVALTDGNVRLTNRNPAVNSTGMIAGSGLTREPWYTADGQPWPTDEVHEIILTNASGVGTVHPLVTVTVPAGETWSVRIQGTMTVSSGIVSRQPMFRIGGADSERYGPDAAVDFSGTVTAANSTIAMVTNHLSAPASFTGTVTIEK